MSDQFSEPPDIESESSMAEPSRNAGRSKLRLGSIVLGCFALIFGIWILSMIVLSLIGLTTGYLYLPPARGSGEVELHGTWARIVSAIILAFFSLIAFLMYRQSKKRRKPKILGE